jgi:hypothetical protein
MNIFVDYDSSSILLLSAEKREIAKTHQGIINPLAFGCSSLEYAKCEKNSPP